MGNRTQSSDSVHIRSLLMQTFDVCTELTEQIKNDYVCFREAEYFLNILKEHFDPQNEKKPKVIIFGTDFPMELVHSLTGQMPLWITGGSRILQEVSDESVPRDTDPVTRAALGELLANESWKATALVVVPCSSDAQRKAAYLLQSRGWKVVTIWIPAVKDSFSHKSFLSELDHAVRTICRHVGRRYSVFALNRSARYFNELRHSIRNFMNAVHQKEAAVPGILRMAVLDSFFMAENLEEWQQRLNTLTDAVRVLPTEEKDNPRVLVIGSPTIFPNYKVPQLLHTSNVSICGCIDSRTGLFEGDFGDEEKGMEALAHYYFEHDSSSAFVQNESLMEAIRSYVVKYKPDGIIWHVLKGQIEYDFELNRCEPYFEQMDLPVIRLETDYQYQDIEQLRIRIEAFAELLSQKRKERHYE